MKISKADWESSSKIDRVAEYFSMPRLLHLRAEFLIHERVEAPDPAVRCICCDSMEARIAERFDGPRLLVDRVRGTRRLRDEVRDVEAWDRLAEEAEHIYCPLRCTREQFAVFGETDRRVIMLSGGSRAGKTTTSENWLLMRVLMRGGRRRRFWIVSQERQQSLEVANRMLFGDDDGPPVLPMALVRSYPTSAQAKDPKIVLIDGTVVELKHTSKKTGGNLKGKSVVDVLWDEAVETNSPAVYTVLVNRLTGSGGTMLMPTTPLAGHFLKSMVVDNVERQLEDGSRTGNPLFAMHFLRMRDNCWYPVKNIEDSYNACPDEATRRRECEGEWISAEGRLFKFFDREKHMVYGPERSLAEIGLVDVTAVAVRRLFAGDNPFMPGLRAPGSAKYIGGQDFNRTPMSVVVCQVEAMPLADGRPAPDPSDPACWRLWVFDVVQLRNTTTHQFAEHLGSVELARVMAEHGFDCRPCHYSDKNKPQNPRVQARVQLMHKLFLEGRIRVHGRPTTAALVKALVEQQADANGEPVKESNTASDRLSSTTDALSYLCWAMWQATPVREWKGLRR